MLLLVACSVVATKIAALELRVSTTCSSRNQLKTYTYNFAYEVHKTEL